MSSDLTEVEFGLLSEESDQEATTSSETNSQAELTKPLFQLLYFILIWQIAFKVSTAGICALLRFLKYFFLSLGTAVQSATVTALSNLIPLTKTSLRKAVLLGKDEFTEYIVCPKCDCVYSPEFCKMAGKFVAQTCRFKAYPNHPIKSRQKECGMQLMKKVRGKSGFTFKPKKIFPYQSLGKAMQRLFQRPGFVQCCELWRTRQKFQHFGYMCDIHDGLIWKDFEDFLSAPFNYLLILNIDWFSPFKHGCYSVGAIYLTIQNLPSAIRNRPENIVLVGIVPGPNEPHLTLNSYLAPLKDELLSAWNNGMEITVNTTNGEKASYTVRLALTCVACDIPATRKVCGFLSHRATLACNKCMKCFPHVLESNGSFWTNCAGFDRENFPKRTNADHRQRSQEILRKFQEKGTKTALHDAVSSQGVRYTVLLELPYFDPIRFPVIDPMHNLFLGTGKHMMEVWLRHPSTNLSKESISIIEDLACAFVIPEGIGRLPSRMSTHFGGFTADQWRNWITIYSAICLWNIIPKEHWECWNLFVKAVKMISCRVIKLSDLSEADSLFLAFCVRFQELYGEKECTMNMHLHLHLFQSLQDYGPPNAFWLYAFERYNGILGSFHINNKAIESQLMERFLETQSLGSCLQTGMFDEDYLSILPVGNQAYSYRDVHIQQASHNVVQFLELPNGPLNVSLECLDAFYSMVKVIGPFKEKILTELETTQLEVVLNELLDTSVQVHSKFCVKFGKVILGDDLIGSSLPNSSVSSSLIMASWPTAPDSVSPQCAIGEVQYFLKVDVIQQYELEADNAKIMNHTLAFVHWRKPYEQDIFPNEIARICETTYQARCKWNFLPVWRISNRCAHITAPFTFSSFCTETVTIACPLPLRLTL